jgi:quercetin dioxygenase-like cupin family protein
MKVNSDRNKRALVHTSERGWRKSPQVGVERIPLERIYPESGPVTSLVKYENGSVFSAHTHPMGEEILVLEGTFEDEHGCYPAGSYVRNPPGSRHRPFSTTGCVLLVKLNWFNENDVTQLNLSNVLDTQLCQVHERVLHQFESERTSLIFIPRGKKWINDQTHNGNELFTINGEVSSSALKLIAGDWLRELKSKEYKFEALEDTVIYRKAGHILLTEECCNGMA